MDTNKLDEPKAETSAKETEKPELNFADGTPIVVTEPKVRRIGRKQIIIIIAAVILLGGFGFGGWLLGHRQANTKKTQVTESTTANTSASTQSEAVGSAVGTLKLDTAKNYGDKYANGILPVGDNQYSTDKATKGKIYMCHNNFVPSSQAGAQSRGPWFVGTTKWDVNKKAAIKGSVSWKSVMSNTVSGATRTISTNDLPSHTTGVFPVASSDPAKVYDANPNTISSQSLTYSLSASPSFGEPHCMGGEIGVMLTGIALFNGFDAGGRDAGAWEVQDSCNGHPQGSGIYHYHTLSRCIKDIDVKTVIGFALDGFPITGPTIGKGNYLTTDDLDECHGITSAINLDGKTKTMYHYVMTQDFPYSASCFRAEAIQSPGQHSSGSQTGGGQMPSGGQPPQGGSQPSGQNSQPPLGRPLPPRP